MGRFNLLATLCLAGCTTAPAYVHVCPVIPTYSKTFEQQAGFELATLPPGDPLAKMISDYSALRRQARDCR